MRGEPGDASMKELWRRVYLLWRLIAHIAIRGERYAWSRYEEAIQEKNASA